MDVLEGDEGVCCRICRLSASHDNPLFSPCKCSGSIKYVHQECLVSWLSHSGHQRCELCRHRFQFRPVYAPNAPSRLPLRELVWGLAVKSASGLALAARGLAVVTTWLFVVPLLTCWMWRLAFFTSFSQGLHELSQRLQPLLILGDCIQGSLISSALILMVLLTTYTADQIRAYWQIIQPHQPVPEGPNAIAPTAADLQAHPVPGEIFDLEATDESGSEEEAAGPSTEMTLQRHQRESLGSADSAEAPSTQVPLPSQLQEEGVTGSSDCKQAHVQVGGEAQHGLAREAAAGPRRGRLRAAHDPGREGAAERGEGPRELGVAPPPDPAGHAAQRQEQQADREFAFNELIGLEGPINVLVENAATVIFTIWAFMVAALWMPFMLGRIVVPTILSWREVLAESWLWRWAAPACSALLGADLGRGVAQGPAAASAGNAGAAGAEVWEGMGSKVALLPLVQRVSQQLEVHLSGPGLNDWVCLGVGYTVLFLLAALAFTSLVVWKLLWSANMREGLRGHTDILRAALADISHHTRVHIGYMAVMVKVSVVLTLELTLLPTLHGCWVDLCLLPLFGSSWADRTLWLQASPISFLLVHWVLGMGFLMGVATFLSVLRQQLRPGALPFFRDPYEGDEEPMRALMTLGLGQQLEREAYALSCLACLTVLLLHIPLRLTKAALPGLLPLRLSLSSPFAEAPTDLLLFHFILPLTVPRMRVRFLMVRGVRLWLRAASRLLGLEDYLLPQPAGNLPGGQDQRQHQAPAFIPLGLGLEEEPERRQWQVEIDGARQRSGRLLALLAAMVGSLVLLNTAVFNVPILTGRLIFWAVALPSQHDVYNFLCGAYAVWGIALLSQQLARIPGARSASAICRAGLQWGLLVLRLTSLAVLSLGVLPLLIGLFLELAVLPLRLRPGETPSCFAYQDWAVGLLFLRLFASCLLGWPQRDAGAPAPPEQPRGATGGLDGLLREPLLQLRNNARRLKRAGLTRSRFSDAFRTVLWPLTAFWGVAVGLPYVISRGVAPRLPFASEEALHAAFTYAWAFELVAFLAFVCSVRLISALERLGAKLRDQRYLLHRELINVSD